MSLLSIFRSTRLLTMLLLGASLAAAGCGSDSGTQPQLLDTAVGAVSLRSETVGSGGSADGIGIVATVTGPDGAPLAGVPVRFAAQGGEEVDFLPSAQTVTDGTGEARTLLVGEGEEILVTAVAGQVASPELIASLKGVFSFTFQFRGDAEAREVETILVKATASDGGGAAGTLRVRWGDGREDEYDFVDKERIAHVYREPGRYRIRVVLEDGTGRRGQASFRLRVGDPVKTALDVEGPSSAKPDEAARFVVSAVRKDREAVKGVLTIDFGDGSEVTVEDFSRRHTAEHTYAAEGEYKVKASLVASNGKEASATVTVRVSDLQNGDEIDMNQVTYLHANVANWTVSSQVTKISISRSQICIFHTKQGAWPVFSSVEGNPWVIAKVNGRWYAGTYEWLKPGQACKGITADNIGGHIKQAPLANWRPRLGEEVYFFVSTIARFGDRTSNERSNAKRTIWPY